MDFRQAQKFPNLLIKKIEQDAIQIIIINRPQNLNAINLDTAYELALAFKEFDQDEKAKIAILTGAGDKSFCSGFDLTNINQLNDKILQSWSIFNNLAPLGPSRFFISKPIIAAVTGYCVAGGLELACWCDMIVSHDEATFGVFCRRVGVPLIDGGTIRIAKIVGLNRARDLILTGRELKGKEAFEWGLVNRLTKKELVLEEAIKLAKQIIVHPQRCLKSDRQSLYESQFPQLERDLMNEFRLGLGTLLSGETAQGAQQFLDNKLNKNKKDIKPKL